LYILDYLRAAFIRDSVPTCDPTIGVLDHVRDRREAERNSVTVSRFVSITFGDDGLLWKLFRRHYRGEITT
jgi:hypothetical protein